MELLSVIFIVLISILSAVFVFFKYSFGYWKFRNIPYDEPLFPYGSIKGVGKTIHTTEFMKKIYDKFKPSGAKLCGIYYFARPIAFILDLGLMKRILVNDFANFQDRDNYYNEVDDPLSANLVTLDGDKWKRLRTKLSPTFTPGKMKFMFPTIVEVSERFCKRIFEMNQQHDQLDMKELCARFTIDVIGTCAFGIDCNTLKDHNAEFKHYCQKIFTTPRHGFLSSALMRGFKNIARTFHVKRLPDDVSAFFLNVVRNTVEYREKNNISQNDFMDLMIRLKNQEASNKEDQITFNELAAQAFAFYVAGFETSSTTLTFCLYELAKNPEIQTKARKVIQDAFKKNDGQFTYEMMMRLPYIDQVLEETLRMYSPIPFLNRQTKNDYRVAGTNIVIEKGVTIYIPSHAIHHDPEYYPNPEKFDPDRFESKEKAKRDTMTWLGFGDGPRNCFGLRFGMMQVRVGLITLLNSLEFSIGSKTTVPISIIKRVFYTTPKEVQLMVKPLKS